MGVDSLDKTRFCFSLGSPLHFKTCCCSAPPPTSPIFLRPQLSTASQITMDVNLERNPMPSRPFPGNTIFDPVRAFDPIQTCETLKQGAEMETAEQMAKFFSELVPYFVT